MTINHPLCEEELKKNFDRIVESSLADTLLRSMMTETAAAPSPPPWRAPPADSVRDSFKQRFYVNHWINGVRLDSFDLALQHYLQPLKNLAEQEDWGENDIILVNYFIHTFYNLDCFHQENRSIGYLKEHNEAIHFHTGLFTARLEPIYAYFPMNKNPGNKSTADKPQYYFKSNRPGEHFLLSSHMTNRCYPLPVRCRYFLDYSSLIMDGTKKPEVNWTHIVDTNWERVCGVLYSEDALHDPSFKERVQLKVTSDLCGALELALRRVEANYRTAVPQFYNSELQLLLPLCVRDPNKPDLALTVARRPYFPAVEGEFTYVAATVLTKAMAYQNARLIARPERDWLTPPETLYDDYEPEPEIEQP